MNESCLTWSKPANAYRIRNWKFQQVLQDLSCNWSVWQAYTVDCDRTFELAAGWRIHHHTRAAYSRMLNETAKKYNYLFGLFFLIAHAMDTDSSSIRIMISPGMPGARLNT
ncbi:hypothetical protein AcW1_009610 [Taiwanofungus camphoratus]|nr:hypothetical protein AcW1_009610 [Antrodia cinnamomea]